MGNQLSCLLTNSQCWQERAVQTATGSTENNKDRTDNSDKTARGPAQDHRETGGQQAAQQQAGRTHPPRPRSGRARRSSPPPAQSHPSCIPHPAPLASPHRPAPPAPLPQATGARTGPGPQASRRHRAPRRVPESQTTAGALPSCRSLRRTTTALTPDMWSPHVPRPTPSWIPSRSPGGPAKSCHFSVPALSATTFCTGSCRPAGSVSYTHLTLPTNREV